MYLVILGRDNVPAPWTKMKTLTSMLNLFEYLLKYILNWSCYANLLFFSPAYSYFMLRTELFFMPELYFSYNTSILGNEDMSGDGQH